MARPARTDAVPTPLYAVDARRRVDGVQTPTRKHEWTPQRHHEKIAVDPYVPIQERLRGLWKMSVVYRRLRVDEHRYGNMRGEVAQERIARDRSENLRPVRSG